MLRKISWLLCAFILGACTLMPEPTQAIQPACPTCAPTQVCAATATTQPSATATEKPQPTATQTPLPPTATNTSLPPTETSTPVPPTATVLPPTATILPTVGPTTTVLSFQVQGGTPRLIQNFAHPNLGCNWLGIGGQVFGKDGKPLADFVVVVTGTLNGTAVDAVGLSGTTTAYGPGGFEIKIADRPLASQSSLWVQLYDLNGNAISYPVTFDTAANCAKNLILVNFRQR